jgi:hypothetical protein
MPNELRNFLALTYDELEEMNLEAKEQRRNRVAIGKIQEKRLKYLTDEKRIKAVTVLFSDLEGRLHMLDYDKKFLIKSWDNLTFDGSSIRGFTAQRESDLRLGIDWSAFYWGPADVFGSGKVLVFGEVIDKGGTPYSADIRGVLKGFADELYKKKGYTLNAANEIEGFLFKGSDAERSYHETGKFEYVNTGGYYHSLPGDALRTFIDTTAEVQRAMGFQNEKDHPEVAPSQFEINYGYGEVVAAADQIQLYKLICRQVATNMGFTASFLPKPVVGVNGSGMHTNVSISEDGKNLFLGRQGRREAQQDGLGVLGSHPHPWQRHLPAAECQRECLSPSRSALRGAEPDQGVGRGPRFDDPYPHRQRKEHARGSAFGFSGCKSLSGHATRSSRAASMARLRRSRTCAKPSATYPTTSMTRSCELPQVGMDDEDPRGGREGALRRSEAGRGGSLSAFAGNVCEGAGSAVSPRRLQPVSVEFVLDEIRGGEPELVTCVLPFLDM